MVSTADFLKEAILDTQGTIRAIDTKLAAFLAALVLPFSFIGRAWAHIHFICSAEPSWIGITLSTLFFTLWLLAILCITLGLTAIGNPTKYITGAPYSYSHFYAGGLFKLHPIDAFLNRNSITSRLSLQDYINSLPTSKEEIEKALAFEKLKTTYIRDIKIHRLKTGYVIAIYWVITGILIFLTSKLLTTQ